MIRFIRKRRELNAKYEAFFQDPESVTLTPQEKKWISDKFQRGVRRGNARVIIRGKIEMLIRNITIKPVNMCRKALPIVWHSEFMEEPQFPFCPVCDEYAYNKNHCIFCGRRFIWNDGK